MSRWRGRADRTWRVIATGLCFTLFGLVCIVLNLAMIPLVRLTSPDESATRWRVRRCIHYCARCFLGTWRALGALTWEVHGAEKLSAPGQLVVANHPSLIDAIFLGAQMPHVNCIVKNALLRNPLLRAPVRWADYIPNGSPKSLVENCAASLRAGDSLLVFPEGTRSVQGQPLKMQRGAAHIALASGCDLLPVTIVCQPTWLTKSDVWYRVPPCRPHWCITVDEPIRLAGLVVPGEPPSMAARRVTRHLAAYFAARTGGSAPLPTAATSRAPGDARAAPAS
ncbi:MAG: lysophospholipid acyltransferase family protein [Panacagrimonas sp.]